MFAPILAINFAVFFSWLLTLIQTFLNDLGGVFCVQSSNSWQQPGQNNYLGKHCFDVSYLSIWETDPVLSWTGSMVSNCWQAQLSTESWSFNMFTFVAHVLKNNYFPPHVMKPNKILCRLKNFVNIQFFASFNISTIKNFNDSRWPL